MNESDFAFLNPHHGFLLQKRVHILFDDITREIIHKFQVFLYATSRDRLLKTGHCDRMEPNGQNIIPTFKYLHPSLKEQGKFLMITSKGQ